RVVIPYRPNIAGVGGVLGQQNIVIRISIGRGHNVPSRRLCFESQSQKQGEGCCKRKCLFHVVSMNEYVPRPFSGCAYPALSTRADGHAKLPSCLKVLKEEAIRRIAHPPALPARLFRLLFSC